MKASPFIIFLAAILTGCGHGDPIARIVKEDSADPHFPSGLSIPILLPATASPTQVVAKVVGNIPILEIRQVHISYGNQEAIAPETTSYTAVLVNAGYEQKVVLLQFQQDKQNPPGGWWWSRVYDLQSK